MFRVLVECSSRSETTVNPKAADPPCQKIGAQTPQIELVGGGGVNRYRPLLESLQKEGFGYFNFIIIMIIKAILAVRALTRQK